ncbi:MAG: alkaline phosphatase family protein [Chthoniobacterales bacterium]
MALLLALPTLAWADESKGKAEHVVMVVFDGMRPDLVNDHNAPTLSALAQSGVFFKNNRAAYPSSTNVNGAVFATGVIPGKNGVIGNQEYRVEVDRAKPFDTADFPGLEAADRKISQSYFAMPTVAEILHLAGDPTAIVGSKPVAQFFDRSRDRNSEAATKSAVVYRGKVISPAWKEKIEAAIGPFPVRKSFPNEAEDGWTTRALTEVLWKVGVPKFSLLWLSEPDLSEHQSAPGSPLALAAIKSSDEMLARIRGALEAKNALASTDIIVVSDHGFSTVDRVVDAAERLRGAGFDAARSLPEKPKAGQILVVTLGGSIEFYVFEHDTAVISRLVDFLQRSDFAGVIFTRRWHQGTFTLAQGQVDSPNAPDVMVACRWNDQPNEYGVTGQVASDLGRVLGEGTHSTLSPHDMGNTLIAAGPDFRSGWTDNTPSGNIDVAPTILWLLGQKAPHSLDGRVLHEAMRGASSAPAAKTHELVAQRDLGDSTWHQTLRLTTVENSTYLVEGNGERRPKTP